MIERIRKEYQIACQPCTAEGTIIQGNHYRFIVLTPSLIRLEYSECDYFEDRATQIVLNRNFSVPLFHIDETEDKLEIITDALYLTYNKNRLQPHCALN